MQLKEIAGRMRECDSAIQHYPDGLSVQWQRAGDNVSLTLERMLIMPSNDELAAWIEAFDVPDDHGIRSRTVAHVSPRTGLTNRYGQVKLSWIERQPIINR